MHRMKKIGKSKKNIFIKRTGSGDSLYLNKNEKSIKIDNQKKGNFSIKRLMISSTTIRFKLITSFMVPIAFIIILGIVSFAVASDGIVKNYEKSTLQTINMTGEYLSLGLGSVEATSIQYNSDDTITKFFNNFYENDKYGYNTAYKYISRTLLAKQISDKFTENIYIISDKVGTISTNGTFESGLYAGFTQTELRSYLKENPKMVYGLEQTSIWTRT